MAKKFKIDKSSKAIEITIQFNKDEAGYIEAWHAVAADPGQSLEQFVEIRLVSQALLFRRDMIESEIKREQAAVAAARSDETKQLRQEADEVIKVLRK